MSNLTERLQQYNDWRRGKHDQQPQPTAIGNDIDTAIRTIREQGRIIEALAGMVCLYHGKCFGVTSEPLYWINRAREQARSK